MFLVILVAMEAHEGVVRDGAYLSVTYAALVATVAIMYARHALHPTTAPQGTRWPRARWLAASSAVFLAATIVPDVGAGRRLGGRARAQRRTGACGSSSPTDGAPGVDEHHLLERMGALTIIVCGEAFVKVAIAVSSGSVVEVDVIALAFQFVLTFAIWLIYFEDIPQAGHPSRPAPRLARAPPGAAAGDGGHRDRRVQAGEDRAARPPSLQRHPRDHRHAGDPLSRARACSGSAPAGGRCARSSILRLTTCVVTVAVGVAAWRIPWIDLAEGVAALTVVAIAHAAIGVRLDNETEVLEPA